MRFKQLPLHEAIQLMKNANSVLTFNLAPVYRTALEALEAQLIEGGTKSVSRSQTLWEGMFKT
jgi:hypothetical protein